MSANRESGIKEKERSRSEAERREKEQGRGIPHYTRELGREMAQGEKEAGATPPKKAKE